MANRLDQKIIYFDIFNADANLANQGNDFIVKKIIVLSATDGDTFELEDFDGNVLLSITNSRGAADSFEVDFGDKGYNFGNKGVRIDVSDCTGMAATDGTDAVWIYLA